MSVASDKASQALGATAGAANAIPVAGQFISAALGIASMLTKVFGNIEGPKKRRRREAAEQYASNKNRLQQAGQSFGQASAGGAPVAFGQDPQAFQGTTPSVSPNPAQFQPGQLSADPPNPYLGIIENG